MNTDAFGNEITDGELVASRIEVLRGDLSETARAAGDYLEHISRKADLSTDAAQGLLYEMQVGQDQHRRTLVLLLKQIKWLLFGILLVLLWRSF